jgi:hypothetical protein
MKDDPQDDSFPVETESGIVWVCAATYTW